MIGRVTKPAPHLIHMFGAGEMTPTGFRYPTACGLQWGDDLPHWDATNMLDYVTCERCLRTEHFAAAVVKARINESQRVG